MARYGPTRAGIIGLWDYVDEEFVFADGWLVLRGPNGSGKTKALELLFPFLFDGNTSPRRLNPFASQDRTMKSNLLFRGKENGLGYVWMEFFDGRDHITIGIGLRAGKHQDGTKRWHFVTDGRVGVDFGLIGADDRVCNRKEIIAQLGEQAVTDSIREYRDRVNNALFGLETDRYEQMLELILTLRRPQLAKELNPDSLSDTLAGGLRPLDDSLIAAAAKSFEDMEAVSRTLGSLRDADEQITRFLTLYGTYVRAQAKLAVTRVDGRMAGVAQALDGETAAVNAARQAGQMSDRCTDVFGRADERVNELVNSLQGLKDSDAYRSRMELEDLRSLVARSAEQAETLKGESRRRSDELAEATLEAERLSEEVERVGGEVERLDRQAGGHAERAGVPWEFHADSEEVRRRAAAVIEQRRSEVRLVHDAAAVVDKAAAGRGHAEEATAGAESALEEAGLELATAHESVTTEREALQGRLTEWSTRFREALQVDVADVIPDWLAEVDTVPDLRSRAAEMVRPVREAIGGDKHELSVRLAGVTDAVAATAREWESVHDQRQDAPDAPRWRDEGRADRPGGPLWRLVRFKDTVDDEVAASLEAAMEAAGLLDAWVGDIGGDSDQMLRPLGEHLRPQNGSLADYLECEAEADATVAEVLASVAVQEKATGEPVVSSMVDLVGGFAHGSVTGKAVKPAAEFIGATARQRRRDQRLRHLEAELERLRTEAGALQAEIDECDASIRRQDSAIGAMPEPADLLGALKNVTAREVVCAERGSALDVARERLDKAVARQREAQQQLQRVEQRCDLRLGSIEGVQSALVGFEKTVQDLRFGLKTRRDAVDRRDRQQSQLAKLAVAATEIAAKTTAAAEEHRGQRARLDSIERSLDTEAATIFEQIRGTEREIVEARRERDEAERNRDEAMKVSARAEGMVDAARQQTVTAIGEARVASVELQAFCDDDLLGILGCQAGHRWPGTDADPGDQVLPAAVASLLDDLRAATTEVQATELSAKAAVTRVTNAVQEITQQLPATGLDHHVRWDNASGIITVEVDTDEGPRPIGRYGQWLHGQREEQETLLTRKEQHVLEDALLTSLTGQIHHRVLESKDLVDEMDLAMRERKTSSGLRLGVSWRLSQDLDPAERELFTLFDGAPARLATKMPQIRKYFADRIKQERSRSNAETTYRDLLAEVLDYRRWRKFEFTLIRPDGRQKLTKRVHSQLSGGEQSVTLHLPLFAAANAVFTSAADHAPRMVALDEAFAGVDEKGRGELMSLAAKFDLQLFMTGYDLWATVPEVAGAAHYSLSHDEATAMVSAMLMVWNGAARTESNDFDGSLAAALGSPGTRNVSG